MKKEDLLKRVRGERAHSPWIVVRGLIQLLHVRDFKPVYIHQQLVSVYGEDVVNGDKMGLQV